ncbi:methionine--tRNA ligase [Clostridium tarantellae]|uniref:methionine--tRNA ligase n=1 Tax=Clostridium tarantellae TaxID=39493 RepID=A0A6I1MHJ1_9CLOT|nr:class I tRNA ligase family protein [Clostridium tarantellae]
MKVIVGNAWPYANGSLHIGRVCSWLPGDLLARYHRAKGDDVIFLSGSDCHGAQVLSKAKDLGKTPKEISDIYHREFIRCFNKLEFSFDIFNRTDSQNHIETVKKFILNLCSNEHIYEKEIEQYFCDNCLKYVEVDNLTNNKCKFCGTLTSIKKSKHLFLKISKFEKNIKNMINKQEGWRENAIKITNRYLDGGLRDRVVTGDIEWGIEVPIDGFDDKKIYVWIEALMGYLTTSMQYANQKNKNFEEYWNTKNSRVYLIHGKENIPFHSIVFPSILYGLGINNFNIRILSSEYLNLEGKTFSTNKNWAIWMPYMLDRYPVDSIRYYMIRRGPEKKDSDFTWKDFVNINNNELVGVLGNFINRTLIFVKKNFDGILEKRTLNKAWKIEIIKAYDFVGKCFENGEFKEALKYILNLIEKTNCFFDNKKPWQLLNSDIEEAKDVVYVCSQVVITLSQLLNPIIPNACEQIRDFFNINEVIWGFNEVKFIKIKNLSTIFNRIERRVALEEVKKLKLKKI